MDRGDAVRYALKGNKPGLRKEKRKKQSSANEERCQKIKAKRTVKSAITESGGEDWPQQGNEEIKRMRDAKDRRKDRSNHRR